MDCMNEVCRATTTSSDWKKGWSLKSGGFATLCGNCGSAFENSVFCETFHLEESGWRDCRICGKRIHCGCIASRNLHEYMDFGGVGCISCANRVEIHSVKQIQIPCDIPNVSFGTNGITNTPHIVDKVIEDDKISTDRLLQQPKAIGDNNVNSHLAQLIVEEPVFKTGESRKNVMQDCKSRKGVKDTYESFVQPSLDFTLTPPLVSSSNVQPFLDEGNEHGKSFFHQGQRTKNILQKPPKHSPIALSDNNNNNNNNNNNKRIFSQARVARPPADGRGRNQLLPRYWPRITDQELQQLSGDLKSSIVPLFEKILSASDAGRIGRLVLPKACAEAYFPTINQSEGIPIRIQDIKGKQWMFQFRFWPNNNSRMYVLEGVTPCIQDMQVQAGDTVIFSRIDPGGQLVIGCRKASNNIDVQDSQAPTIQNGDSPGETSFSGITENILTQHISISEKKNMRNMKNKRLLMPSYDAVELRITWEEAQELLRPSPNAEPTIFMVEDLEFEEFDEPPIFGKRTIFTSRASGEQEQLAQCDSCSKWRRLPVHVLLSAKWTCADNIWDLNRCSCSAPGDINPSNLESFFSISEDSSKKRRISDDKIPKDVVEPSGLDALATIAALGDNLGVDTGESTATTRHPRHRPGCTCIVCIQPPSGKGKHEPMCKCNVCLTVKRRFKTLMMRKKKKQSEREEAAQQEKEEDTNRNFQENEMNGIPMVFEETEKNSGRLDLNSDPNSREDDILAGLSLTSLMNVATLPLDLYCGENNGTTSLGRENGANEKVAVEQENIREDV